MAPRQSQETFSANARKRHASKRVSVPSAVSEILLRCEPEGGWRGLGGFYHFLFLTPTIRRHLGGLGTPARHHKSSAKGQATVR